MKKIGYIGFKPPLGKTTLIKMIMGVEPLEKTKDQLFKDKQKAVPDLELIETVESELHKLCKTGGRSLTMSVPPMVTDFDMAVCELIRRFKEARNL